MAGLAQALATVSGMTGIRAARQVEQRLRVEGGSHLAQLVQDLRARHGRRTSASVLVVVDQLEEVFSQSGAQAREEFLTLLRDALDSDPALWVVATLRSEFLAGLLASRFATLVQRPVVVGVLGRNALSQVIEEPAALAGLRFLPGVVARIVDDTGHGDALPLLAFTLQQLFLRVRDSGVVRDEDYERLGGVVARLSGRRRRSARNWRSGGSPSRMYYV